MSELGAIGSTIWLFVIWLEVRDIRRILERREADEKAKRAQYGEAWPRGSK